MKPPYKGNEFQALKMRYEDQVELLRTITQLDLKIFSGYLTLQVALGAWLITHPLGVMTMKVGIFIIDLGISAIATYLFYSHLHRRREAVDTIKNLNAAFGFTTPGVYVAQKSINAPPPKIRPFWLAHLAGIIVSTAGIALIIFAGAP